MAVVYHTIMEAEWFSNRDYIGPKWTRKAIRTVQAVLNSTHGKIGRGRAFFFKAFGRNEDEFLELIQMPEAFIIKRWDAEINGLTKKWQDAVLALNRDDRTLVDTLVATNSFDAAMWKGRSATVAKVMAFYLQERDTIPLATEEDKKYRIRAFEKSCPTDISEECKRLLALAERGL